MDKETYEILRNITNKDHIKAVSRGNRAILYALRIAKKLGKKRVHIQDQGGWITYKQFALKLKLDINIIKTDFGLIDVSTLEQVHEDSAVLVNSLSGYFAEQDMDTIYNKCFNRGSLVINDITGTIGTEPGKIGDILVCSFGEGKPVDYGRGGLIATDNSRWLELTQIIEESMDIKGRLLALEGRQSRLRELSSKIKEELSSFDIIHKDRKGINVVVRFHNPDEKKRLELYCKKKGLEYTICPRQIRVDCDAISIEVKRLKNI